MQQLLSTRDFQTINLLHEESTDLLRLEIDFPIWWEAKSLPIEVKAEGNVRSNSLSILLQN